MASMAIIVLVLGMAAPFVQTLKGSGDLTKAASDIGGLLEKSRAYAMANNTYVFVGFCERDGVDASRDGSGQVFMVTAASKDGTAGFGSNNSNLVGLSKVTRLSNIHLEGTLPQLAGNERPDVDSGHSLGSGDFASLNSFEMNGHQFTRIIQFDPRGSAIIQDSDQGVPQWVEIGLVSARGNTVVSENNWAALVLDGVTGSVRVYRP